MSLLTAAAVHNNAVWCDAVCRALGCDTERVDGLWVNRSPSPPYYSNAVTLEPSGTARQLARLRSMLDLPLPRPWSVKDGYRQLDLAPLGFVPLFDAEWIGLSPDEPIPNTATAGTTWVPAASDTELLAWERAWLATNTDAERAGARQFHPGLLADRDIRFLAGTVDGRIVATAIANRSEDASGAVAGISNIVLTGEHPEASRSGAVAAARGAFPGLPVVGYERDDDLVAMLDLGFRSLGPLRVWITDVR